MTPADDDEGTPVSVQIRERIRASRQRFHSNDNIAEFIQPGELEKLLDAAGYQAAIGEEAYAQPIVGASKPAPTLIGFNPSAVLFSPPRQHAPHPPCSSP